MHGALIAGMTPAGATIVFLGGPQDRGAVDDASPVLLNGIAWPAGIVAPPAGVQSKGSGIL